MPRARSVIRDIAESTGLPSGIWTGFKPIKPFRDIREVYVNRGTQHRVDMRSSGSYCWIPIREETVSELDRVPFTQLLGKSTLVRTTTGFTAMVSIAEAAFVQLGELHGLLGTLMEVVEQSLRADNERIPLHDWWLKWHEETSMDELRTREVDSEAIQFLALQNQRLQDQNKALHRMFSGIWRQNQELLDLI